MFIKPLLSICCITYNHAPYIRQCLDGFIMQKTNFPIEVLVHDDASTDGTTDIVREYERKYPDIIKPIYQTENQYSKRIKISMTYNYPRAQGKYIAYCEGDDYWTDQYKLQKQADFLEANPEYGMVYSNADCFIQKTGKLRGTIGEGCLSNIKMLSGGMRIPTSTVIVRKDLLGQYYNDINLAEKKDWLIGDLPQWLWFIQNSKIHYMNITTSVYRILPESACHTSSPEKKEQFFKSCRRVGEYFIKYCNITDVYYLQMSHFRKVWGLFNLACIYNKKHLFEEVREEIKAQTINVNKNRMFYIKAVLRFRWLRYSFILIRLIRKIKRIYRDFWVKK